MKSILIAGYRSGDLGIFSETDPRVGVIKKAIARDLRQLLEEGVQWFLFGGNLGFEVWVLDVLRELKEEGYEYQLATIFCFANHGENWNEANQQQLEKFRAADFVSTAYDSYKNPGQLKLYQQFLIDNTDGVYLFYDSENETNLKYLVNELLKKEGYTKKTLTFEDLHEIAENFEESE